MRLCGHLLYTVSHAEMQFDLSDLLNRVRWIWKDIQDGIFIFGWTVKKYRSKKKLNLVEINFFKENVKQNVFYSWLHNAIGLLLGCCYAGSSMFGVIGTMCWEVARLLHSQKNVFMDFNALCVICLDCVLRNKRDNMS